MAYLGYYMSEIKYGNFKINYCLQMNIKVTRKTVTNDFCNRFSLCIRSRKNDPVNGMPENVALRRILTKMTASVFHRIYSNIKTFCRYKTPILRYLPHEEAD